MRPYRVPDALKPDVDRQIRELLELGLIRPSNSPMASPSVCVSKNDGGVRIAVDYRYLNSLTVGDDRRRAAQNRTRPVHQHVRHQEWILADTCCERRSLVDRVRDS